MDGELKFDDEEEDGPPMERDLSLMEGNSLPEHLAEIFPPEYYTKPIEDIDQYIKAKVSSSFAPIPVTDLQISSQLKTRLMLTRQILPEK